MEQYTLLLVWVAGAIICAVIAHLRQVDSTFTRQMIVAVLGPLAIPLVFLMKPNPFRKRALQV